MSMQDPNALSFLDRIPLFQCLLSAVTKMTNCFWYVSEKIVDVLSLPLLQPLQPLLPPLPVAPPRPPLQFVFRLTGLFSG